jgi:predicted metal-dependent peptidase
MAELSQETADKIVLARMNLYRENPFFMLLALYFNPKPVEWMPTAAVDGKGNFYINEDFAAKCSVTDMQFVIAHEVMHIVTQTCGRMPPKGHPLLFNIASDCVINYMLCHPTDGANRPLPNPDTIVPIYGHHPAEVKARFQDMKDDKGNTIEPTDWAKYDNWVAEEIYFDLLKEIPQSLLDALEAMNGDEGGNFSPGDGDGEGKPFDGYWWDDTAERMGGNGKEDPDEQGKDGKDKYDGTMSEEERKQWATRVSGAAAAAKQAGKLPGSLDEFCTEILQPKHNWKNEVRRYASNHLRKRYDWKRQSRRTAGVVRTPGKSPHSPTAVLYMDTSGSMSDADLRQCIGEMASIISLCGGDARLILGDAEIYYDGEVDKEALKKLPVQRGGTDFRPIFDRIDESGQPPQLFIGFTDCCGPFPDNPPAFPVIWCRPKGAWGYDEAPWGKNIDIEIDQE